MPFVADVRRYAETIRHLRASQTFGRILFNLRTPRIDERPAPPHRARVRPWQRPVPRPPSLIAPQRFRFLNLEGDVRRPEEWNEPSRPRLWRYNAHYFDDLAAADAGNRLDWQCALIEHWIDCNPPPGGAGWEAYPLSLRMVNWIKWALAGHALSARAEHSLAKQARYLARRLEFHLLGNHLLANAKALMFAGLWFQGAEADRWLDTASAILARELPEQILPDGGHFERSPMYHCIVLEDLLDLANLFAVYGRPFPDAWRTRAAHMCGWLSAMTHPDGQIALFNDSAFGIAAEPDELYAYAARLGIDVDADEPPNSLVHLKESGYVRLAKSGAVALLDVGPLGPDYLLAHGHADTLSFELSLHGRRLIVDSGCSRYEAGPLRTEERSTRAHNTVVLDGLDSSEVWGAFRVARRAHVQDVHADCQDGLLRVWAAHDGYQKTPLRVRHQREWTLREGSLGVVDDLYGQGRHGVEIPFHLHPDVRPEPTGHNRFDLIDAARHRMCTLTLDTSLEVRVETARYNPQFGMTIPNPCILAAWKGNLPARFSYRLDWHFHH